MPNTAIIKSDSNARTLANLILRISSWFTPNWLQWSQFSDGMLRKIEKQILSILKSAYRGSYVDIGPVVGAADKIWTISMNTESPKTPLVLLHGLGAGVALWCLNLDAFAANRPVYAIDLLGFGRSSRPNFSSDAAEAESQFVKSVEEWRRETKLDEFILLGHSMGGFLAASYALDHPERVKHLILADPWGFPEKPSDEVLKKEIPLWIRTIGYAMSPFNPLAAVRFAGPWGQWVIDKVRPDLARKFSGVFKEENLISQYIYQCNAQTPSGESAFRAMTFGIAWAKNPMLHRIERLDKDIPITIMYGSRSWMDSSAGNFIKQKRIDSYVKLQVISGAGHHVYADKADVFNKYVVEACSYTDPLNENGSQNNITDQTESDTENDENRKTSSTTQS